MKGLCPYRAIASFPISQGVALGWRLIAPSGRYRKDADNHKDYIKDKYVYEGVYDPWYEKMKPYQIYGQCVIIRKKDKDNPRKSETTVDDMKMVKAIYNNWWESNKNEDLDSLRKKWRENGSPLFYSSFMRI